MIDITSVKAAKLIENEKINTHGPFDILPFNSVIDHNTERIV